MGGRMAALAPLVDLENPLFGVWGCGGGAFCGRPGGAAMGCWGCGGLVWFGGLPFIPELGFRAPLKCRDACGCGGRTTSSGWTSESATLKSASSKSILLLEDGLSLNDLIAHLQIRRQMCLQMLDQTVSQLKSQAIGISLPILGAIPAEFCDLSSTSFGGSGSFLTGVKSACRCSLSTSHFEGGALIFVTFAKYSLS